MKVLVLTDLKIGSSKQAIALGKSISNDVVIENIEYNFLIKIPNIIRPGLLGVKINGDKLNELLSINPDIIIYSGRRLTKIAIYLKKHSSNKNIKLITITNPECNFREFYKVILPFHDRDVEDKYNNIIRIIGSISSFDENKMKDDAEYLVKHTLRTNQTKYVSFFIGGSTKTKTFNKFKFSTFVQQLSNIIRKQDYTLLISTSRRTSDDCFNTLENNLFCKNYLYNWKQAQIDKTIKNPYNAYLYLSDIVVATADSISMISEALTLGKSVYLYRDVEQMEEKHIKFTQQLLDEGYVKNFDDSVKSIENFSHKKLDELNRIKELILENINKNN